MNPVKRSRVRSWRSPFLKALLQEQKSARLGGAPGGSALRRCPRAPTRSEALRRGKGKYEGEGAGAARPLARLPIRRGSKTPKGSAPLP